MSTTLEEGKSTRVRNTNRTWCFTWNNYTEQNLTDIKNWLDSEAVSYVIGKEVGESGTPHLQGCFKFSNKRSFNSLKKKWAVIHLEECRNWDASVNYCKKGGEYFDKNISHKYFSQNTPAENDRPTDRPEHVLQWESYMEETYNDVKWYNWQQNIINIINSKPDDRKVYWFWETTGNTGKSFLTRYLDWKYNAIIANGKQQDVFNQYKMYLEEFKVQPTLAIIDIPRSHQDYVCYSTLEKIKDGLIYSGKYEGGKLRLIPHHLIIFANFEPIRSKLSEDRWVITDLSD